MAASPKANGTTAARFASASRRGCRSATSVAMPARASAPSRCSASSSVWDTEHNNGVLLYLLLAEHAIEIVADRGLNRHVDAAEWARIAAAMRTAFQGGQFEAGLNQAIDAVDALLTRHFAVTPGQANPNELPDLPERR